MTAFARQERNTPFGDITLELRAVNHRYLEINPRLPDELRAFEPKIRSLLGERLNRGKIDCTMRYAPPQIREEKLTINETLVKQIVEATRVIDGILYEPAQVSSLNLLKWPGVINSAPIDEAQILATATELLEGAITDLIEMRESEGDKLRQIILQRCSAMEEVIEHVKTRLPEVLELSRNRLEKRLAEMTQTDAADGNRLEQEMVMLAQRLDVDEELDRLETHLGEIRKILEQSKPVGRRLDFLMQELNREANTLGSKSADIETTQASVELKVLIEQMREQIQNIE
ncbi:MAG: YicC family protein [Gammaproteobacteria bacterium]|nr:YicC family protein [Gammaproteobacteria bacterium]